MIKSNNINMIIEIIVMVLLFVIFIPIRVNFVFYINLLKNRGAIAVQVYILSLIQDKFKIADGQVTARNQRDKETTIDLSKEDKCVIFIENFVNNVIHKLVLNDTYVGIEIGNKNDAMVTAILSGTALMIVDLLFAQVFSRKSGSNYEVDSEPLFCQNKLVLCMQANFYITVFDILFAIGKAYLKTLKRLKGIKKMKKAQQAVCED